MSGVKNNYKVEIEERIKNFHFNTFIKNNSKFFLLLTALVAICYANALTNSFVSDDLGFIKNPPTIKSIFPDLTFLFSNYPEQLLRLITFKLGLTSPVFFRLPNIFVHLFNVYLIYIIISLILNKKAALFTACLFAVHPILIESVTWISGGPYSKLALFFLLSFLCYILSANNKKWYIASLILFYFSLVHSDKGVPLCLAFPIYELSFGNFKKNWPKSLPFFGLSFIKFIYLVPGVALRKSALENQFYQKRSESMVNPLQQIPIAITTYFELIFWPDKLTLYHSEMYFTLTNFYLRFFFSLVYMGFIIYGFFRNKPIFFWLSFYLIALAVTLNPFSLGWIVAERYVYLASLGIFAVIGYLFSILVKNNKFQLPTLNIFFILIFLLTARTIIRNVDWKNEDNLWLAAARTSPSSPQNHNNLGDYFARYKNNDKAIREFKIAIALSPNYADAYHNLANIYQVTGQTDQAVKYYQKTITINPNIWQTHYNLAVIYYQKKDFQKALEFFKQAYSLNPDKKIADTIASIQKTK